MLTGMRLGSGVVMQMQVGESVLCAVQAVEA